MKITVCFLAAMVLVSCAREKVEWVSTTFEQPWQVMPAKMVAAAEAAVLEIDPVRTLHVFTGFGTAASELSWTSLSALPEEDRNSIFRELFAPGQGANLTMARTPVGANDFSLEYYSYDDVPGDFELEHFSVERDERYLLPFLRAAKAENPDLRVWASPWCPPAWMKINRHYANAPSRFNDLDPSKRIREGEDAFEVDSEYLDAYARYFGKYIEAYRQRGIDIFMVMPQNEPNSDQPFPACTWTPDGLKQFISVLGPEMDKRGVEVWLGTMERADVGLWDQIVKDPDAGPWIRGMGFQWAGKGALPGLHAAFPALPCYMTEQECGNGANDWRGAMHSWDLMREYITNGCTGYFYWNTSLFKGESSTWGWRQNSLVTVDRENRTFQYTPEFYVLKHASHFVRPGAAVLAPGGTFTDALAFANPDGQVVVLAANQDGQDRPVTFRISGKDRTFLLPANSLNTIIID